MKTKIQRANERGGMKIDWLDTKYSFSFANYYNAERMGFGVLRVLNDDYIAPGGGFPTHDHANMEIITIVFSGGLAHKDSSGGEGVIHPGEVQVMSAGSGVEHSEFNESDKDPVTLFQIWIQTKEKDIPPRYDQKDFKWQESKNELIEIVSGVKNSESLYIRQDAYLSIGNFEAGKEVEYKLKKEGPPTLKLRKGETNGLFFMVIEGEVEIAGEKLNKRDSFEITDAEKFKIIAVSNCSLLVIEVPF